MATPKLAEKQKHGVWLRIMGQWLRMYTFDHKTVKVTRNRAVSYEQEPVENPFAVLIDPRVENKTDRDGGIRGVRGVIHDSGGYHPKVVGDTYLAIDGEIIPFALVEGLTGSEGQVTKSGRPKKRNHKFSTPPEGILVTWNGIVYKLVAGVSQPHPNGVYLWGTLRAVTASQGRVVDESTLVDLSDLSDELADA